MTPLPDKPRLVVYQTEYAMACMVASNIALEVEVVVVRNKEAYDWVARGLPFKQDIKCSLFDCKQPAVGRARISIDNAPKTDLPLCQCHLDAAQNDFEDVDQTQGSFNRTV